MLYHLLAPPSAALDKQADELARLLRHSKSITAQFVTVAGSYKPSRARMALLAVPDRVAGPAAQAIAVICEREDAVRPSAAVRQRPEWQHTALLVPTDPQAPPLDGGMLDGWDSAFLSVTYRPGRAIGQLRYCPEDQARLAALRLGGWKIITRPKALLLASAARRWEGTPSLLPVPGGAAPIMPHGAAAGRSMPAADDAPAPLRLEIGQALTNDSGGLLLGVAPDGGAVRLARRAMTLAVDGPHEARREVVQALLLRALQSGLGIVAAVDRALLPAEMLAAWEARTRLLDVQNISDSSAIPWREIAPDLLAQAIGGPAASLPALPSRFGAVLDALEAEALRVPEVLGLATMPGDDLRGALAAGGLIIAPQDGDAASAIVARLLLAYLASAPAIGRGLLLLADPALLAPESLRQQAIQAVLGERSDALLRLAPANGGWRLSGPDGTMVAELLPDLLEQPAESAGALVDTIVREIAAGTAAPAPALEPSPIDPDIGWWAADPRDDDLDAEAQPTSACAPGQEQSCLASDLDSLLDDVLQQLMEQPPATSYEAAIQSAVASGDFGQADQLTQAWADEAPQLAQPRLWQVILAEHDADRAAAALHALQLGSAGALAPLLQAIITILAADLPGGAAEAAGASAGWSEPIALRSAGHAGLPPIEPIVIHALPNIEHAFDDQAGHLRPAPASPANLSDGALLLAWQAGESVPQLVAKMTAAGLDSSAARARVRAMISGAAPAISPAQPVCGMEAIITPNMPAQNFAVAVENTTFSNKQPHAGQAASSEPMSGIAMPLMGAGELDDQAIWERWEAGERSDHIIVAISGRRGGPKAEAARDRMYRVVIPRIVDALGCQVLADRMAAGENMTGDPGYAALMQRIARSEHAPTGNLEQALVKRLLAARREPGW